MELQRTLKSNITISGKGLHTGKNVNVSIIPANVNHGIVFCRTDLDNKPLIPALADYVSQTSRGTTIEKEGVSIATMEHLLATLSAFGIDNAVIELDSAEVPILDGSAAIWTKEINKVGFIEQEAPRNYYRINKPIHYTNQEKGIELIALPYDGFKVSTTIDFNSNVLPPQVAEINDLSDFEQQIAPCRTFVFLHEVEFLLQHNLIKGGDLDNALIFVEHQINEQQKQHLTKLFNKTSDDIKVEKGILNNVSKHFENEPARHKTLDFIGDISLVGRPLKGHFIIKRPGHHANTELARTIRNIIMEELKGAPKYDPNKAPVYNVNDIRNFLPHRYPFLLVDKIIEVGEGYVVGLKNVTGNEEFFNGHFPQEPVMPGVLIVEAMGQAGGILVLKDIEDPENYSTYFMKIDGVKFRNKVVPGDTLIFRLKLTEPIRRGIVKMHGEAFVADKLVVEADLMAQVVKTKNN